MSPSSTENGFPTHTPSWPMVSCSSPHCANSTDPFSAAFVGALVVGVYAMHLVIPFDTTEHLQATALPQDCTERTLRQYECILHTCLYTNNHNRATLTSGSRPFLRP